MIVAERKPIDEILENIKDAKKIMVLGCRGCVTVCLAGGEKEAAILASEINMARNKEGKPVEVKTATLERQCDYEYFDAIRHQVDGLDAVISMACGVGVQAVAERFPNTVVYPCVNTKFMGVNHNVGEWAERCLGCGQCVLSKTGGVCPVARCSKSLFNGPCGGSQNGKCEISKDVECGWQLIYDRLANLNKLDSLLEIQPPKDWTYSRDGGPRKLVREDAKLEFGK